MASSEFPWFVKPCVWRLLCRSGFLLRCFGPPGCREHGKHSEMPIVHTSSVAKILVQMSG